jgi:hypothetical protein
VYTIDTSDVKSYQHWSEDLEMIIIKDGTQIRLTSDEIRRLVYCLPKTIGGTY